MGLDICYYNKLTKVSPEEKAMLLDGYDPNEDELPDNTHQFYINPDYAEHAEGLNGDDLYRCEGFSSSFHAGSYTGYNRWRESLAFLAGYGEDGEAAVNRAWSVQEGPFWELINFSDCEGVIGPVVSAKLAKDFEAFDEKAKQVDGYFYQTYQEFSEAFSAAADNGAVRVLLMTD